MISNATLWFGIPGSPVHRRQSLPPRVWTCVGLLAIPLWATWPALALRGLTIPAFECLTIGFAFGWLVLARLERVPAEADDLGRSPRSWIVAGACALALTGSNAFHILATHYIPAAEANLISYLWPVEIIVFGAMLGLFKLGARHYIGLSLGFSGAIALLGGSVMSLSIAGAGLALLSGISWAAYCLFRLTRKAEAPARVLQRGCAISTGLCLLLHILSEPTMIPDIGALASSAAVGVVPLALGNLAWDEGFRRGDSRLLAVMAYATPLCSALILVAFGLETFTPPLLIGAGLIVFAGVLSRTET